MIKDLYKQKGWTATDSIVSKNRVEVKLTIDRRYTFCCSKCGNNTGEPLKIAPGRDSHCPDRFFSRINEEEKKKIKFLGIDRSNACKAAAVRHLPHVIVCYDAYHLVSNMNEVLDKIRRATMKHPSYTYSSFMKGKRFVLLRGRETLNSDVREELRKLSLLNRNL